MRITVPFYNGREDKEIEVSVQKECSPGYEYCAIPSIINAHTHCADIGFIPPKDISLEELVAPPNGLKHRYLDSLSDVQLVESMKKFSRLSSESGASKFIDFREGGVNGCKLLRKASQDAVILGRPLKKDFDYEEAKELLDNSDGIGLPSLTDCGEKLCESCQDLAHKTKKIFQIHVSERVREDIDQVLQLNPDFIIHQQEQTDQDFRKCADQDVPIAICPRSNLFFGIKPRLKVMIQQGVSIMIGTDNAMIQSPNVFEEINEIEKLIGSRKDQTNLLLQGFETAGKIIGCKGTKIVSIPKGTTIQDAVGTMKSEGN